MEEETIKICSNHQELEQTPLIFTFAFFGAEYWCPACGATYGMLGVGEDVLSTKTLKKRLGVYKKMSKKFLRAKGKRICAYWKSRGRKMTWKNLPPQTKAYYINIIKSWKYKFLI